MRQLVGERAVCYLRFQKVLLWVVSLYFAVGVTILVPLNLTGRVCDFVDCPADIEARVLQFGDRLLFMTSSENVARGDAPRLATYFAVTILFTAFSHKALGQKSLLRHTTLVPPGELPPPRAQYYSLMARRVPRFVTSSAASRALQQDQAPGSPAARGGVVAEDPAPSLGNGLVACTAVDGTAFLVFQTNRAASDFLESHRAQFGKPGILAWLCRCQCIRPSTSSVVKTTSSGLLAEPRELIEFDHRVVRAIGLDRWKMQWAPPPDDVLWEQLTLDTCNRYTRWALLTTLTMMITLLLIFPLTVAGQVSRFTDIIFDAVEVDTSSLIFTLFSKYLPTLLALIINAGIIPLLIETQAEFEGHFRRSDISSGCLRKMVSTQAI